MNYIETERLILRDWNSNDLKFFYKINNDPKVMQYSAKTLNIQESKKYYTKIRNDIKYNGFGLFAVELKKSNQFIGYIGLTIPPYNFWPEFIPCVEIGWRLDSLYWNKGYATEGAKACINYGFSQLHLNRIISMTKHNNSASIKVMEKIGMIHSNKPLKIPFPVNFVLYEILNQCFKV